MEKILCIHGVYDNKEVTILYESDFKPCYMEIQLLYPVNMLLKGSSGDFSNAIELSASLQCSIGTSDARNLLHDYKIPKESKLWHLNYDGWFEDRRVVD